MFKSTFLKYYFFTYAVVLPDPTLMISPLSSIFSWPAPYISINLIYKQGFSAVICYLLASLASLAVVGLVGCALCGLAVGIMWPGTITLSSRKCPGGGTAMFAFLALAGDLGATAGPVLVGKIAEITDENLKNGLLTATIFPVSMTLALLWLHKKSQKLKANYNK